MRRFLFVLQGIIPKETVNWRRVSEEEFLGPGIAVATCNEHSYVPHPNIILMSVEIVVLEST